MKLTKRGEVVLWLGVIASGVIATYVGWLWVRSLLLIWAARGYDLR